MSILSDGESNSNPFDGLAAVEHGEANVDDILAPAVDEDFGQAGVDASTSNPAPAAEEIVDQGVMAADKSGVNPLELVPGPEEPVTPEL